MAASQKLLLYQSDQNFGDHRTYEPTRNSEKVRSTMPVEAISLDEYFEVTPTRVDFLKMDIQGSEYDAFCGMQRILRENPNITILTEFWPKGLEQAGASPEAFLSQVRACGMQAYRLEKDGPYPVDDKDILGALSENDYTSLLLSRVNLAEREAEG
jgi:hypothetical protein